MHPDIITSNNAQLPADRALCTLLAGETDLALPDAESKVWHAHPVWFLDGNPVVGYSKRKNGIHLMFWSGQSFEEAGLLPEGKFKAAGIYYLAAGAVDTSDLRRWLAKARDIQWDYKHIVQRKGQLERLK